MSSIDDMNYPNTGEQYYYSDLHYVDDYGKCTCGGKLEKRNIQNGPDDTDEILVCKICGLLYS